MPLAHLGQQAFPFHQPEHGREISHSRRSVNAEFARARHNDPDIGIFEWTRGDMRGIRRTGAAVAVAALGTARAVAVKVTTPDGTSAAVAGDLFTYK